MRWPSQRCSLSRHDASHTANLGTVRSVTTGIKVPKCDGERSEIRCNGVGAVEFLISVRPRKVQGINVEGGGSKNCRLSRDHGTAPDLAHRSSCAVTCNEYVTFVSSGHHDEK
jgi:hypothetical protein